MDEIAQCRALAAAESDADMKQYAEQELVGLRTRRDALQSKLEDLVLSGGQSYDSIIMEIRAMELAATRSEALFAGDLYNMYRHYARDQGWKVEDISFNPGEQGGYKDVVFSIKSDEAFQHLQFESGGQRRVQPRPQDRAAGPHLTPRRPRLP